MSRSFWRSKPIEWLKRYLPLEVAATICALSGGMTAAYFGANGAVVAYAATWAENAGFYGVALFRELRQRAGAQPLSFSNTAPALVPSARALAAEFGPAELLDSFVIRPAAMYALPMLTGDLAIGLIFGKIIADVAFFGLAIAAYEWRKRR